MAGFSENEEVSPRNNGKKHSHLKWIPLLLSLIATAILIKDIAAIKKLTGAALAQADFDIFLDFLFWVLPSAMLVAICLLNHLKVKIKQKTTFRNVVKDPFVGLSILMILLPILIYCFSSFD